MKEKIMRFMYGRYGIDSLGRFLIGVSGVCFIISLFFRKSPFYTLGLLLLFYVYFRMFSRNIYKRSAENQDFLQRTAKIRGWFEKQKYTFKQLKTHHIYRCPTCKQKIRIPRGKGKIEIRCPKCNTTFVKRS